MGGGLIFYLVCGLYILGEGLTLGGGWIFFWRGGVIFCWGVPFPEPKSAVGPPRRTTTGARAPVSWPAPPPPHGRLRTVRRLFGHRDPTEGRGKCARENEGIEIVDPQWFF